MDLAPYAWEPDDVLLAGLPVIVRWAALDPLITQVWAFGSRAGSRRKGRPRPGSDIDIGFQVVAYGDMGHGFTAGEMRGHGIGIAVRARDSLGRDLGQEVDVQFMHPRLAKTAYAYGRLGRRIYQRPHSGFRR